VVQLALDLAGETRAKLVLDYRDRWFGPGGYGPMSKKSLALHQALEREAVRKAALVVTVSESMAEAVAHEQGLDADQWLVVPNGYSAPSDSASPAAQREEPGSDAEPTTGSQPAPDATLHARTGITISHVGTVIARNRPDLFFESLSAMKGNAALGGVTFRFVGNLSREYLVEAGLSPIVQTTGLLPRGDARRAMRDADGLLLLTGAYVGQWGHNAKLFEYIQSGRPVLCLEEQPGSNDRKLLERFIPDRAFFAPVDDPEAISQAIVSLKAYAAGRPGPAIELDPAFREFSRAAQAAVLAERLQILLPS
jgi:glycosyltransferase involved in cell wall biosynthesis